MLPPTDSTDSPSKAREHPMDADSRVSFEESTGSHLEAALRADDCAEKNYHIRSALQRVMIADENRSE